MLANASLECDTHQPMPPKSDSVPKRFVARQPIFDQNQRVYGYELLFRSGLANFFSHQDGDLASHAVIDDLFLFGMEALTEGRKAFINCTRLGKKGVFGHAYRLVLACEGADWDTVLEIAAKLKLSEETISEVYFKSLEWSKLVFQA